MSHIRSLESFADDYDRLLDGWAAGGVDGLVIGPMRLNIRVAVAHSGWRDWMPHTGEESAAFDPDPQIYADFGVSPPPTPRRSRGDLAVLARLDKGLTAARDRGWPVWLLDPLKGAPLPAGTRHVVDKVLDPSAQAALAARLVDTVRAFPMATGVLVDGPSWGFEITEVEFHGNERRKLIFDELPERSKPGVERLGYDYGALVAARDHLWTRLHQLDGGQIAAHRQDDPPTAMAWLGGLHLADWVSFRVDALHAFYDHLAGALRERTDRDVELAIGPRPPAVARLAGYDLERLSHVVDVFKPKLYYWHRGYDGLVGTAYRYARTLRSWNPGLSVTDACQIARLLFGDAMPAVTQMIDFDRLVTPDFVGQLARRDVRHVLDAAAERARVVPWVDTGRAPHDGDPLTALHLEAIIDALENAGVQRFTYLNSTNLTEADWAMLSHYAGVEWNPATSDFVPCDRPVR